MRNLVPGSLGVQERLAAVFGPMKLYLEPQLVKLCCSGATVSTLIGQTVGTGSSQLTSITAVNSLTASGLSDAILSYTITVTAEGIGCLVPGTTLEPLHLWVSLNFDSTSTRTFPHAGLQIPSPSVQR